MTDHTYNPQKSKMICDNPGCQRPLEPGDKFCECKNNVEHITNPDKIKKSAPKIAKVDSVAADLDSYDNYLIWKLENSQVARKIDHVELANNTNYKGIIIQEGIRGMIFVNGKFYDAIEPGKYTFASEIEEMGKREKFIEEIAKDPLIRNKSEKPEDESGIIAKVKKAGHALWNLTFLKSKKKKSISKDRKTKYKEFIKKNGASTYISVILFKIESMEYLLNFDGIKTRNTTQAIQIFAKLSITNGNKLNAGFFETNRVLNKQMIVERIKPLVLSHVSNNFKNKDVQDIDYNEDIRNNLKQIFEDREEIKDLGLKVDDILYVTADNAQMDRLRKKDEELYLSEQELIRLGKFNDFSNRLQDTKNLQKLKDAKSDHEMEKALLEINKDKLLSESEFQQYKNQLNKDKMRSQAEVDALALEIEHEQNKTQLNLSIELDQIKFDYEYEKKEKTADYERKQRKLDAEVEAAVKRGEDQREIDRLEKLAEIHRKNKDAKTERKIKEAEAQSKRYLAELEKYMHMSPEQIVASNPGLTVHGADALKTKWSTIQTADSETIERIYKESMQTLKGTVIGISNAADERINKTTDQIATGMGQAATATRGDTNSQRESIANRQCPDCNTMNREDRTICSECAADL